MSEEIYNDTDDRERAQIQVRKEELTEQEIEARRSRVWEGRGQ